MNNDALTYNWQDYLKFAPLKTQRTAKGISVNDITTDEFFLKLYASPSENSVTEDEVRLGLIETSYSKILFLTGYAGCGKTVFVQKTLNSIGVNFMNRDKLFELVFDFEESNGSVATKTTERVIRRLAKGTAQAFANTCLNRRALFLNFRTFINNSINVLYIPDEYEYMRRTILNFSTSQSILNCRKFNKEDELTDCFRNELLGILDEKIYSSTDSKLRFLLTIDYLWRVYVYNEVTKNDEMLYVVYDNLDLVDRNQMIFGELVSCIFPLLHDIDSFSLDRYNTFSPLRIIIPARKISYGILNDFLAGHRIDINVRYWHKDISDIYSYSDIIKKRVAYVEERRLNNNPLRISNDSLSYMRMISKLCQVGFVNTKYKKMFNYNYRECVDEFFYFKQISEIEKSLSVVEKLASSTPPIDEDPNDNEFDIKTHSGASALFLRAILDDFENVDLFSAYKLIDININTHNASHLSFEQLTSFTRVFLTYLYNMKIDDRSITINKLFEFFDSIYSPELIINMIISMLKSNGRWRRLIYIKRISLKKYNTTDIETALKNMKDKYLFDKGHDYPIYEAEYAEIEICDAGMVYVDYISAHFEFFSIRTKISKPLFSITDMRTNNRGDFEFDPIIEEVINSVTNCIRRLRVYNEMIMRAKGYNCTQAYYDSPFVGMTKAGNKQFHEERIIFQHIYQIEDYRRYLLKTYVNTLDINILIEINRKLTSYIRRYTELFRSIEYLGTYRQNIKRQLRSKVDEICNSDNQYRNFAIMIEAY
ncbi:hypothetical protein AGMMS49992_27180 [Clostridia bacterium]|nr:hypothetical protein AGMMS49992_27180 [Clostridia bacterium]